MDEVTKWPEGSTDDCVMASWFLEAQLPNIWTPTVEPPRLHSGLNARRGLALVSA